MGPEPGLQFGLVPAGVNMCEYGEYVRSAGSSFGGNCATLLKGDNTWMLEATATSQSYTYLPLGDVQQYIMTLTHNGASGQKAVATWNPSLGTSGVALGFDIADPAFVSYMFDTYVPYDLLPHGPNAKNNIPTDAAHPTYIEIDAFSVNRSYFGVLDNYINPTSWTNAGVTWDSSYPQTDNDWYQGWEAFFAYAKNNHPEIRLSPHMCGMSDWSVFHDVFANVPSLMKEPFQISDPFNHGQLYNQIQNSYWFANVAPPVFNNEPRVISWGTWVDNGDIHTALALYLMVRGPNTFFDALTSSPQQGIDPKVWLPTINTLGTPAGSSAVLVLNTVARHAIGDGYNLLERTYSGGATYLNMTGTTQTITPPVGSTDWNGNVITAITLADGKGEVVLSSGPAAPQVSLAPSSVSFANQNIGTTSAAQTLTLANTGTAALSISGITVTGTNAADFNEANSCGTSVAVGASCTISVTFTPTSAGSRSASVSVADNATGSPHSAALSGTGVGVPQASLAPASVSFANQNLGRTSAAQTLTLSNTGTAVLSISGIAVTGTNSADFNETNSCGTSVAVGASCTISVTFTPTSAGARSASVSVADNATGSPHNAALSGTGIGIPQVSLTPPSVSFANQNIRTTSAAQMLTLSNTGTAVLSITGITVTGTNAADFNEANSCGTSVAVGASCTISVTFTPTLAGARSASVSVADNATGSPHSTALSGTGIGIPQVSLTPPSVSFANQNIRTTSAAQTLTLSNTGTAALSITGITVTGTNAADFNEANSCGTSVAVGASCTISVTFTPTSAGARSASVSVADNATGSPHSAALSGTGIGIPQVSLTPPSVSFTNQNIGTTSAAQMLTLSNTGTAALSISGIAVTGTNATDFTEANSCGTSVAVGASCTISVTFIPTSAGARSASVSVSDNATGSPHSTALSGTGVTAPQIAIYEPTDGAVMGKHFTLGAIVKNAPSAISQVQFYDNGKLLGTAMHNAAGEYLLTWQTVPSGTYTLTAIATDLAGNKLTSAAVNITVY